MPERRVPVTVEAVAAAPPGVSFDTIMPIDLSSIFERSGPLPGVVGVRGQTGAWTEAGQTRTVLLSDGSEAREQLTRVDRPERFAYVVGGFTGPLRHLVADVEGEWSFYGDEADGETTVRWTYAFRPRRFASPLVRFVLAPVWRRYAAATLDRAVRAVERRAVETGGPTGSGERAAS